MAIQPVKAQLGQRGALIGATVLRGIDVGVASASPGFVDAPAPIIGSKASKSRSHRASLEFHPVRKPAQR